MSERGYPPVARRGFRPLLLATAALGLSLCGRNCPNDEPPTYDQVGIRATDRNGAPVPGGASGYCATVPVLAGSRVTATIGIDGPLSVTVLVTNEQVVLDFEGASAPTSRTIALGELGAQPLVVSVTAQGGAVYDVAVSYGCAAR
jgi:hypothetical protein